MKRNSDSSAIVVGLQAGARLIRWFALGLLLLFCCSGITTVAPGEVALVLRMGRLTGATPAQQLQQPGLLFALPFPLDQVIRVPVKQEGQVVVDGLWHPMSEVVTGDRIDPVNEGYCLTGDQYVLQVKVVAKYQIRDAVRFRLRVEDPEAILRNVVLASLTQTVSSWNIDDAWRRHQQLDDQSQISLEHAVRTAIADRIQQLDVGIELTALDFQEIHPPRHVRSEFADVQNALNEKQRDEDAARGDAAEILLGGEAARKRLEEEAQADRQRMLAQATAEVAVVKQLVGEYRANPELVRQRLRLDALSQLQRNGVRQKVVPRGQPWRVIISDSEKSK